jgi:hypothetical protein
VEDGRGGVGRATFGVAVEQPLPPTEPSSPPTGETIDLNGIPNLTAIEGNVLKTVRQIYRQGQNLSPAANPGIFSVAGDTPPNVFLADLGDGAADFDGLDDAGALSDLLFYYVSAPLPVGGNSFQSGGVLASNPNWRAEDLLDPALADPNWCQPGETPLDCELRVNRPTVLFVIVGRNDVLFNTAPNQFQIALDTIVQASIQQGAIPVLVTIPGDPNVYPALAAINSAVVRVADQYHLPLINLWRRIDRVGPSAIDPNSLTLTTSGVGDQFTDAELKTYGVPNRNLFVLRMLQQLRLNVPIP